MSGVENIKKRLRSKQNYPSSSLSKIPAFIRSSPTQKKRLFEIPTLQFGREIRKKQRKMPQYELSDSESAEAVSSEEEPENETSNEKRGERNEGKLLQYERERLKRIEENKKRMEALGLHKMASSFIGSVQKAYNKKVEKKGKKKLAEEDEDYNPTEEEMSSSGKEDDEFSGSQKKKVKGNTSTPRKQGPAQKLIFDSDFVEDDDALMQAIALSLQDSAGFLNLKSNSRSQSSVVHLRDISTSKTPGTNFIETSSNKRNENFSIQNDSGKRKKRKPECRLPVDSVECKECKCLKMNCSYTSFSLMKPGKGASLSEIYGG